MEATTLEQAAESLLSTSEAPEAQGDNLSEAVDSITEPSDDDQGEELEAVAESDDDVEASDEDYDDDQIDDEDLVEAEAEDTNLIPVKVDGKEADVDTGSVEAICCGSSGNQQAVPRGCRGAQANRAGKCRFSTAATATGAVVSAGAARWFASPNPTVTRAIRK